MLILNGRALGDKGVGKPTCKDKSVVDYVICSSSSMMFLSNFEAEEFCPLSSDARNVIKFALKGNVKPTQPKMSSCPETKHKRWEENKKHLFFENLNQNKGDEILKTLNGMTQPTKDFINASMSEIEDIFKTTRKNTFAKQKDQHFNDKTSINSKPWFNNHCPQARKKYHLARRIYNINKTHPNQEELLATSRNYKREIN